MLITYRTATGEVVDNTGTNSAFPMGPSEEDGYVNTDAAGLGRADLAQLRLHDQDDADLVYEVLLRGCTVVAGAVVLGPKAGCSVEPPAPPVTDPSPLGALVGALRALTPAQAEQLQQLLTANPPAGT